MDDLEDLTKMSGLFLFVKYPIRFFHPKGRKLNKNSIVFRGCRRNILSLGSVFFNKVN